jgi:hypothetical protein
MRHVTGEVKSRIQGERRVALRHHKAIALRIVRVAPEDPPVKGGEDVGDRQGRPDVPNIGPLRLLEDVPTNALAGDRLRNVRQSIV